MTAPTTDRAYVAGEDAPEGLEAVEVALSRDMTASEHFTVNGPRWYAEGIDGAGPFAGPFAELADCERWIERERPELRLTYWVGLHPDGGAVNVDAAVQRAEADHPGYTAQDWGAV